jgi:hypothetical protein
MECQDATAHIADYLAGTLPVEELEALRVHAAACAACRDELTAAEEMWQHLGRIPPVAPDLPAMRRRFDTVLAGYQLGLGGPPPHAPRATARQAARRIALSALAAAALLMIGIGIGRQTAPPAAPAADTQIAALREELSEMRQMMSLSLLQQQSATARLQGVISTGQIDDPRGEVVAALLDTLMYDPNPNVRLATVDALKRFMDRDLVRRRTLDALPRQTSPLVQIALIDFVVASAGGESAEALRTLAKDPMVEAAVRTRAAERLRQLGAKS